MKRVVWLRKQQLVPNPWNGGNQMAAAGTWLAKKNRTSIGHPLPTRTEQIVGVVATWPPISVLVRAYTAALVFGWLENPLFRPLSPIFRTPAEGCRCWMLNFTLQGTGCKQQSEQKALQ